MNPNPPSELPDPAPSVSPLSPFSLTGGPFFHYVIVRADLPRGLQAAQCVHAAGESAVDGPVPEGTHAVVLQVNDEEHLLDIADKLHYTGVPYKLIIEPDLPFHEDRPLEDGQGTAIGIPPTQDRKKIASVLGRLGLLR